MRSAIFIGEAMKTIYTKARAKINLNLLVLDKKENGYHNIKSVFQKINLYDEIYITKTNTDDIKIKTNISNLDEKENIIYKAYLILKQKYKKIKGVQVLLNKKIPMQSGMAGGSTDCASFIVCMNKLFDLKMSKDEMKSIGKSLGADVVSCFYNKALKAEGIGDIITTVDNNSKYYILIIKPNVNGNTKEMFKLLDNKRNIKQIDKTNEIIKAIKENNVDKLKNKVYNVFENVFKEKEVIEKIKKELKQNGAIESLMTGSGSAVYGIFKDKNTAKKAYNNLMKKYQTYICTSYNSKKEEIF